MSSLKVFLLPLALLAASSHAQDRPDDDGNRRDERAPREVFWDGNCRVEQWVDRNGDRVERRRCRADERDAGRYADQRVARRAPAYREPQRDADDGDPPPREADHRDQRRYEAVPAPAYRDEEPVALAPRILQKPSAPLLAPRAAAKGAPAVLAPAPRIATRLAPVAAPRVAAKAAPVPMAPRIVAKAAPAIAAPRIVARPAMPVKAVRMAAKAATVAPKAAPLAVRLAARTAPLVRAAAKPVAPRIVAKAAPVAPPRVIAKPVPVIQAPRLIAKAEPAKRAPRVAVQAAPVARAAHLVAKAEAAVPVPHPVAKAEAVVEAASAKPEVVVKTTGSYPKSDWLVILKSDEEKADAVVKAPLVAPKAPPAKAHIMADAERAAQQREYEDYVLKKSKERYSNLK